MTMTGADVMMTLLVLGWYLASGILVERGTSVVQSAYDGFTWSTTHGLGTLTCFVLELT